MLVGILNWIAFGSGPRHFSGGIALPFVSWSAPSSAWFGRAAFGAFAVLADIFVACLLVRAMRNALRRRER